MLSVWLLLSLGSALKTSSTSTSKWKHVFKWVPHFQKRESEHHDRQDCFHALLFFILLCTPTSLHFRFFSAPAATCLLLGHGLQPLNGQHEDPQMQRSSSDTKTLPVMVEQAPLVGVKAPLVGVKAPCRG